MIRKLLITTALLAGGLVAVPTAAQAGCKITVKVKNDKNKDIVVDWRDSKVKIKGGIWKKLGTNSQTIPKGKTKSHSYNATFGCGKKRQYKVYWSGGGSDGWKYYPDSNSFTTKTSFTITVK